MSEPKTQQEPTMEEILASIRRIISEDGEEAAQPAAKPAPAPAPAPAATAAKPEPPPPPPPLPPLPTPHSTSVADDVLELTQMVKDDGSVVDLSAAAPEPPPPPPPPSPPRIEPRPDPGGVISQPTASAAAASFSNLASAVTGARGFPIGYGARTIEELVKELLRPMLRDWLDANLPGLVQRIVEREVAKLAGGAEDEGRH